MLYHDLTIAIRQNIISYNDKDITSLYCPVLEGGERHGKRAI